MPASAHILVVDDDPQVRRLLRRCFEGEGYRVSEAASGADLRRHGLDGVDLITLDLTLGDENGLELARQVKSQSDVPIIMVTGKGETIDRVVGLELGADDYIAKPFHVREVLARVRSVIRRTKPKEGGGQEPSPVPGGRFRFGGWIADFDKMELVSTAGEHCALTSGELKLLEAFVTHANRVLSRDQLMDMVKGHDWSPLDRSVDNQIARLRKKIEADPASPELIKTVRGAGYKFTADVSRD